jgi:hypothetical protein
MFVHHVNKMNSTAEQVRNVLGFLIAFMRWMKSPSGYIEGPIIRNLFEFGFRMVEGDWSNVKVAAVYCDRPDNKFMVNASWNELVNNLTIIASLSKLGCDFPQTIFGSYKFCGINIGQKDLDESPEAELVWSCGNRYIIVNFVAWREKTFADFDVNAICFTNEGFQMKNSGSSSFLDALEGILHREAAYVKRADLLQSNSFPVDKCVSRAVKQKWLHQIYDLISNKWLKIKQAGYNIVGKQADMFIERVEECFLTGRKPNYPCVNLQCGHSISIMAYKGIIAANNDDTESIKCPMCRADLLIKFCDTKKTRMQISLPDLPKTTPAELPYKRGTTISKNLVSMDALEAL